MAWIGKTSKQTIANIAIYRNHHNRKYCNPKPFDFHIIAGIFVHKYEFHPATSIHVAKYDHANVPKIGVDADQMPIARSSSMRLFGGFDGRAQPGQDLRAH
jgi:hypothetical protein